MYTCRSIWLWCKSWNIFIRLYPELEGIANTQTYWKYTEKYYTSIRKKLHVKRDPQRYQTMVILDYSILFFFFKKDHLKFVFSPLMLHLFRKLFTRIPCLIPSSTAHKMPLAAVNVWFVWLHHVYILLHPPNKAWITSPTHSRKNIFGRCSTRPVHLIECVRK